MSGAVATHVRAANGPPLAADRDRLPLRQKIPWAAAKGGVPAAAPGGRSTHRPRSSRRTIGPSAELCRFQVCGRRIGQVPRHRWPTAGCGLSALTDTWHQHHRWKRCPRWPAEPHLPGIRAWPRRRSTPPAAGGASMLLQSSGASSSCRPARFDGISAVDTDSDVGGLLSAGRRRRHCRDSASW